MQPPAATEAHRSLEVVPPQRAIAPWRVVSVQPDPERRSLHVTFVDGTEGDVELDDFLRDPAVEDTVFGPLREAAFFGLAEISLGAVVWPNGADLAPDAMYDQIRESGRWVLGPV